VAPKVYTRPRRASNQVPTGLNSRVRESIEELRLFFFKLRAHMRFTIMRAGTTLRTDTAVGYR